MICDDSFFSFDDSFVEDSTHRPSDAIRYNVDLEQNLWMKIINLDLCDRSSLTSLMNNISFLRSIVSTTLLKKKPISESVMSVPTYIAINKSFIILYYELCPFGSVFNVLSKNCSIFSEKLIAVVISRAVKSLLILHSHKLLHRGVCPAHMLISNTPLNDCNSDDELGISLCGLGSLAAISPMGRNDLPPIYSTWRGWTLQTDSDETQYSHPSAWFSPELLIQDFKGYSFPSDIYSIGLAMVELFTGKPPYFSMQPSAITGNKFLFRESMFMKDANQSMQDVYTACTHRNPDQRPTAEQLLEMPWIKYGLSVPFTRDLLQTSDE